MAETKDSHQYELLTLIDPQRIDLQTEAVSLIIDCRVNIIEAIENLLECAEQ